MALQSVRNANSRAAGLGSRLIDSLRVALRLLVISFIVPVFLSASSASNRWRGRSGNAFLPCDQRSLSDREVASSEPMENPVCAHSEPAPKLLRSIFRFCPPSLDQRLRSSSKRTHFALLITQPVCGMSETALAFFAGLRRARGARAILPQAEVCPPRRSSLSSSNMTQHSISLDFTASIERAPPTKSRSHARVSHRKRSRVAHLRSKCFRQP